MLETSGKNNRDGSFNWVDAVVDAAIPAGIAFFSSTAGASFLTVERDTALLIGVWAAALEFFIFLGMKRGIREKE